MKTEMNPWAGLASYQDPAAGSTLLFCGRDNESYDLAALADDNIFCTLYGKSGTGKTSLLNAGMFPRLRAMGYLPLSIRLGMEAMGTTFQQCVATRLGKVAVLETVDTVPLPVDDQDEQWLWAWFARTRFVDAEGKTRFPVLVFDQFEEVFRSRRAEAETLLRQIHFMMDPSHSLGDDYDYNFRFLASIREDDLYLLEDSLDRHFMGDMKQCRYRLNSLTDEGAREVILKPGEGLFSTGEQDAIVDTVIGIARSADGSINTNILSLVCSRIYDHYKRSGDSNISLDLVRRFVSSNPFEQFYNEVTADLSEREKQFIEDRLVDAAGRRGSVSEPDFEKNIPNGAHLLEGTGRILQRVASGTEGRSYRIELIHDSFCAPLADQKLKRAARRRRRVIAALSAVALVVVAIAAYIVVASIRNARQTREILIQQEKFYAKQASQLLDEGDTYTAFLLLNELTDPDGPFAKIPLQPEAERQMRRAIQMHDEAEWQVKCVYRTAGLFYNAPQVTPDGKYLLATAFDDINIYDYNNGFFIRKIVTGDHFESSDDERTFALSEDGSSLLWLKHHTNDLILFSIETGKVLKKLDMDSVALSVDVESFGLSGSNAIIQLSLSDPVYDEYGELLSDTIVDCIKACNIQTCNGETDFIEFENSASLFGLDCNGSHLISSNDENEILIHDIMSGKLISKIQLDKNVLSWKSLTENEILLVKQNSLSILNTSQKKTIRVIDRGFDMETIKRPQVSKDRFMVSNGDTVFLYNIKDYHLNSYYILDRNKHLEIYLSDQDNDLLVANQSKGVIYRLSHNPHYKKNELFPKLSGNYKFPISWQILDDIYDKDGILVMRDTNYSMASINNGWYLSPSHGDVYLLDNIIIGNSSHLDYYISNIENDSTMLINGQFLSTSSTGEYCLFFGENKMSVFNTQNKTIKTIPNKFRPLFFAYNDEIYCKYNKTYDPATAYIEYDSLFKYNIEHDSAVFCMRLPSIYCRFEDGISTPDRRFHGFPIKNASVDSIRYIILDTKKGKLYKTKTYFYDVKITPDGKYILTSESDGYIRLRKATDFTVVDSHLSRASQIKAISADGQYAVIYPDNSEQMDLWKLHPLNYMSSHTNPVYSYSGVHILFPKDGKSYIVVPDIINLDGRILHGSVRVLSQQEVIEYARQNTKGRRLTEEEKKLLME